MHTSKNLILSGIFLPFLFLLSTTEIRAQSGAELTLTFNQTDGGGGFPANMLTPWTEQGVSMQIVPNPGNPCNSGDCFGIFDGMIWLYPATLRISLPQNVPVSRIEIDVIDYCGTGCTYATLRNNAQSVSSDVNSQTGQLETFVFNIPQGQSVTTIDIGSFEGVVEELRIKGGGIEHFHQVLHFPERRLRRSSDNEPFAVTADGSDVSTFRLKGLSNNWTLRLQEDPFGGDPDRYGSLTLEGGSPDGGKTYRFRHPNYLDSGTEPKVLYHLEIYDPSQNTALANFPLEVWRTPVVMVHGLRGSRGTFAVMENALRSSGLYAAHLLYRADYSYANEAAFSRNAGVPMRGIVDIIHRLRNRAIAAGKADLVGHSMGGILSRLTQLSPSNEDNIHKIITLNTPHAGSQLADLGLDTTSTWRNFVCNNLDFLINCNTGAIRDLAVESDAIRSLNGSSPNIPAPVHAVVTHAAPPQFNTDIRDYFSLLGLSKLVLNSQIQAFFTQLYNGEPHDLVVADPSQRSGLTGSQTSLVLNQHHMGSPDNGAVINVTRNLLKENPASASFTTAGFNPAPLNYNGSPLPVAPPQDTDVPKASLTLNLTAPAGGTVVHPGDNLSIEATGSDALTHIILLFENGSDLYYRQEQTGREATFSLAVDSLALGRRKVIAFGVDSVNNSFIFDTTHVIVEALQPAVGISVYPENLYLPLGELGTVSITANFGGFDSDISSLPDIQYQFRTGNAQRDSSHYILGQAIGMDTLVITYNGLNSPPIPIEIYQGDPFVMPLQLSQVIGDAACGQATGQIALLPSEGLPPYQYAWSNGATDSLLTNLGPGIYTVTVTDASGLALERAYTLTDSPAPTLQLSAQNTTCGQANGSVQVSLDGGAQPFTFLWSNGADTQNLSGVPAGNYQLTVTDGNGCQAIQSVALTDSPAPSLQLSAQNTTCGQANGSVQVSLDGGAQPFTFLWSNGADTQSLSGVPAGNYQLTVTDGNGCEAMINATVETIPVVEIEVQGSDTSCDADDGAAEVIVTGGAEAVSYLWSTGAAGPGITGLSGGTYHVTVTDVNGCEVSAQVTIIGLSSPEFDLGADTILLQGETLTLRVAGEAGWTYEWSTGATGPEITVDETGVYELTITNEAGCSFTDQIEVTFITDTREPVFGRELRLFPNPVREKLNLSLLAESNQKLLVKILDGSGRIVGHQTVKATPGVNTWELPVEMLPTGNYLLTIEANGQMVTRPFVKK